MPRTLLLLALMLLVSTGLVFAGGGEEPRPGKVKTERIVSPDPQAMHKALGEAREAAGGQARPTPSPAPTPRTVTPPPPARRSAPTPTVSQPVSNDAWMLGSREGECAPLDSVKRKVDNIGTFSTPEQFSRQMRQRGHQSFALDISDQSGQMMRIKVPDLGLDLLFVKSALCR